MPPILPNKLPEHALQRKGFRRVASSPFPKDYRELAAVFAGGALGTLARTGLSCLLVADPTRWPWPTFTVNIVGAFLVGYFTTRLLERLPLSSYRRPLRWADDLLDHAGRDAEDDRTSLLRPGGWIHRR